MIRDSLAKFFKVDSLISNLTGYVETRIEILKVEAKEEISKSLSNAILYGSIAFMFVLVIVFLSVAVGITLTAQFGNFAGFGIVAAFYLIVGITLFLSRQKLFAKLEKKIKIELNKKK